MLIGALVTSKASNLIRFYKYATDPVSVIRLSKLPQAIASPRLGPIFTSNLWGTTLSVMCASCRAHRPTDSKVTSTPAVSTRIIMPKRLKRH